ncbi:MAG TPA: YjbE family putative metal transport protein, partial [Ktedonobacteraceae bacterium]|nr:YjbE family putative metal transport protein [Ktedonobacteraceae bacterium]
IVLVDLVLSGDNALIIGVVAAELPRKQRWMAIVVGGAGAILLRIGFAILATLLLQVPLLQAIGGVILIVIALRLLLGRNQSEASHDGKMVQKSFFMAVLTILAADAMMSLDNVLAVGALADGNILILASGLLLSIVLVLAGSSLISRLMRRLPWLLDIASLILAWTAANMILSDLRLGPVLDTLAWTAVAVPALTIGTVLAVDIMQRVKARRLVHI